MQEEARIIAHGGVVGVADGDTVGIKRVFDRVNHEQKIFLPGINMSRSFGDTFAEALGVTCTPDITELEIDFSVRPRLLLACAPRRSFVH